MLHLLIICAAALAVHGQSTSVSECKLHVGDLPKSVYIEGCSQPPCHLPQNQDVVIHITFEARSEVQAMVTLATAYVETGLFPLPVPFPLGENSLACNFLENASCPLAGGQTVKYTLRMNIDTIIPKNTKATIELRVVDGIASSILCIRFPIVIDPPAGGLADAAQLVGQQ